MVKSINTIQINGKVNEINLKVETKEVELKGANNTSKKVTCKSIGKVNFSNPSMTLDVDSYDEEGNVTKTKTVGVNYFTTHEKKLDENGNVVDNPNFKSLETLMEYEKGTRIRVNGSFADNGYAKDGEWKHSAPYVTINAFAGSSSKASDQDSSDCRISGIIRGIKHEVNPNTEEETGRLKIDFYMLDRDMKAFPIELTVEEDIADDFEDNYAAGDSAIFNAEVVSKQVGGTKKSSGGSFKRRDTRIVSGYEVMEISVFSDEMKPEEENELFIPVEEMQKALKERVIMKEAKVKESKEKKNDTSNNQKSKGLGNRTPKIEDESFESPF